MPYAENKAIIGTSNFTNLMTFITQTTGLESIKQTMLL